MHPLPPRPSVNGLAAPLVDAFASEATSLRLRVEAKPGGPRLIDAGAAVRGSVEAGRWIAEICLAGLGRVTITPNGPIGRWPFSVQVQTADPVLACLGSQYAGWSLKGQDGFFALGSGPGRAAAATESLFEEIGYRDSHEHIALVLEAGAAPPSDVVAYVAREAGVPQEAVTFIYAPTQSLAGSTQVVARVLEVALHKVHTLGFPLDHIVDGLGTAPIAPPGADFVQSMGRTNDAIIYGGRVQLFVTGEDADARSLAEALPSITSRDYGAPFADIFSRSGGDFYAIDPHLFSPAEVIVSALDSGRSFRAGQLAPDLVDASFS